MQTLTYSLHAGPTAGPSRHSFIRRVGWEPTLPDTMPGAGHTRAERAHKTPVPQVQFQEASLENELTSMTRRDFKGIVTQHHIKFSVYGVFCFCFFAEPHILHMINNQHVKSSSARYQKCILIRKFQPLWCMALLRKGLDIKNKL